MCSAGRWREPPSPHACDNTLATNATSDRILVDVSHQAGDEQGAEYSAFVRANSARLLKLAFVLTCHGPSSEDLVQEALLQAYRRWHSVQEASDPGAYVRRILVNIYLQQRRRKHVPEVPLALAEQTLPSTSASFLLPEQDAMLRAISTLSRREQVALVLRYYEDLDDRAIASALRCRPATVRSLLHRGLKKLRTNPHLTPDEATPRSHDV